MKLRKKINYILLPVIILVFLVTSYIYYSTLKQQLISNQVTSLNDKTKHLSVTILHQLQFIKSYVRQHIDSKEASLLFNLHDNASERASHTTQFINRFAYNQSAVKDVIDFTIITLDSTEIVHVNLEDPFATPVIQDKTSEFIATLHQAIAKNSDEMFSQYYFFINPPSPKKPYSYYVLQVFSPYYLASTEKYKADQDLYLVQVEVNSATTIENINTLIEEYRGFLSLSFEANPTFSNSFTLNEVDTTIDENAFIKSVIETEVLKLSLTLDPAYFDEDLVNIKRNLLSINLLAIFFSSSMLLLLINRQIINPITSLARSIKSANISNKVTLQRLAKNDEVAELNNSYISLINRIHDLANNDPLTGLSNRIRFTNNLEKALIENQNSNEFLALFYIDLDNFKYVNDSFGHDAGDRLLVLFSEHLKSCVRSADRQKNIKKLQDVARLGGDEFVVLLTDMPNIKSIESVAQRITELFINGFDVDGFHYDVHASIGVTYTKNENIDASQIFHEADAAMYATKRSGKNGYQFFSAELEKSLQHDNQIEILIKDALQQDDFYLVYMPAFESKTLSLKGYEVLLRSSTLIEKGIGPDKFIPIAERTELITKIDLWVVEQSFKKLKQLITEQDYQGFFSINVSSKELSNDRFYKALKDLIKQYQIPVQQIELEITETCLMPDDDKAIDSLNLLKSLGVKLAIDDFGTGFTAFSQIVNYPLDTLKIDRSFVQQIKTTKHNKKPAIDIIFDLAKAYQLDVIVEGVETIEELEHIRMLGCHMVQGYYFTKPQKWEELIEEHKS